MEPEIMRKVAALTIAGSDSGGNAGIQADLRAFHVFGVHGCTVLAALTAQNPFGVSAVLVPEPDFLGAQLDAVLDTYSIAALKVGMLGTPEIVEVVASHLLPYSRIAKVIDPVMVATSGATLLQDEAVQTLQRQLLPLASLITPNLPETEALLGRPVTDREQGVAAVRELAERFNCAVLVKGGHASGTDATDLLFDGERVWSLATPRIVEPLSTHGTGCSLSAAIAAGMACGYELLEAVVRGKAYVYESIRTAVGVGEAATVLGTPRTLPVDEVRVVELGV